MRFKEFYNQNLNEIDLDKLAANFEKFAGPIQEKITKLGFKFKSRKPGQGQEVFLKTGSLEESLKLIAKVAKVYESVGLKPGIADRSDLSPQWRSGKTIFAKVGLLRNGVVIFFEEPF